MSPTPPPTRNRPVSTITMAPEIHKAARERAREVGLSLSAYIEQLIRMELATVQKAAKKGRGK